MRSRVRSFRLRVFGLSCDGDALFVVFAVVGLVAGEGEDELCCCCCFSRSFSKALSRFCSARASCSGVNVRFSEGDEDDDGPPPPDLTGVFNDDDMIPIRYFQWQWQFGGWLEARERRSRITYVTLNSLKNYNHTDPPLQTE